MHANSWYLMGGFQASKTFLSQLVTTSLMYKERRVNVLPRQCKMGLFPSKNPAKDSLSRCPGRSWSGHVRTRTTDSGDVPNL